MSLVVEGKVAKATERPYDFTAEDGRHMVGTSRKVRVLQDDGDVVELKLPDGVSLPAKGDRVAYQIVSDNRAFTVEGIAAVRPVAKVG